MTHRNILFQIMLCKCILYSFCTSIFTFAVPQLREAPAKLIGYEAPAKLNNTRLFSVASADFWLMF